MPRANLVSLLPSYQLLSSDLVYTIMGFGKTTLLSWYAQTHPHTVDLVGDIAGREPFLVHGESLIRYCIEESRVDFQNGFQVLHAVYAVERFLSNLHKRGCDFDVVFFRNLRDLCVPTGAENQHKHQLTRKVLLLHLTRHARACAKNGARASVREFESPDSQEFLDYLQRLPIHFILCHEGDDHDANDTIQLRHMIYKFISGSKKVAIINSIEWKSSKVFAPLLSRWCAYLPPIFIGEKFDSPYIPLYTPDDEVLHPSVIEASGLSIRERVGILACRSILERKPVQGSPVEARLEEWVQAFLLHLAVLKNCTLLERQRWVVSSEYTHDCSKDDVFLRQVTEASLALLESEELIGACTDNADWDLYDPVDGFVFAAMLRKLREGECVPPQAIESWKSLWSALRSGAKRRLREDLPLGDKPTDHEESPTSLSTPGPSALPFSHPVLDEFLKGIELEERQDSQDATSVLVFEDLHHWHNTKLLISHKKPEKLGFFARKRKQERTRDIVAYSASLTNARGKIIDPEIIVVKKAHGAKGKAAVSANHQKESNSKAKKGINKTNKKGGRENALKAAQEVQDHKALDRRDKIFGFWDATCREIENDHSLVSRYLKTIKFLLDRSQDDIRTIGSEVYLYLSHILGQLWAKSRDKLGKDSPAGLYLIAMIWKWLQQISAAGASKTVVQTVEKLATYLQMPTLPIMAGSQTRELRFKFDYKAVQSVRNVVKDYRALQLEHGGPYMERRFDSQPDGRVPFDPDAWQRKVLDSIDSDNSLLVIAPTSAGKTFISFYAMKKVLEESDDGVLVYVAPTKALVNQIAAEVGARFNKSYHKQEGKSVWAIYTRDYRVQNPTGCQVLVTVPHILQIMLLAPTNAKGPNAWSRRIKRIIFDEVHCIGQTEDGVIWEQLLLLAPCPIIALSATVGNPEAFRDWLSLVQKRKGQKLDMVVHTARYSDLRKFVYRPKRRLFEGFQNEKTIPVPGLDEGDSFCPDFQFVHPVAALTDRNRTALDDLSLEARDCLSLWTSMKKVLSSEEMIKFEVPEPSTALPEAISKSDVLQWEANLKRALRRVMETQSSTFQDIRKKLEPVNDEFLLKRLTKQVDGLFNLASDLHRQDALPALVFHYDGYGCENIVKAMFEKLQSAEDNWKEESSEWVRKTKEFEAWNRTKERQPKISSAHRGKGAAKDDSAASKQDLIREGASVEASPWESFDPDAPLSQFSFADTAKAGDLEVKQDFIAPLKGIVAPWLLVALRRGLGVHHAGMNRQYRQVVEILFRKGYLRLVVATGTLALGINMPCKTVVFHGDSIFLTAQNYRQASGRAGRRGFDLLGNVVFSGIPDDRVYEIMSARLPDLNGQFPISTTLVLRLLSLLHGTENCDFAAGMVQSLLSQTRLYLGGPESELSVKHHLRFSIEYLRRQHLLSEKGAPINFSGLVGHLYYTENAIFAFHSLLKGGYFHRLCSRIDKNPEAVLLEMMLVLCHLFNRIPVRRHQKSGEIAHRSSSIIFLPRLPPQAEELLMQHNRETLSIFKGYVQSYISHNLSDKQDRTLPFTKTAVGQEKASSGEATANMVRSPFVALSGFKDDFESIHELCETVRGDVFLEESAIPFIPVWPHDSDVELNSYVYDFYKHGSMHVLSRDNGIKRGDVWFFLQDFSRTLSTIVTSLTTLICADEMADSEDPVDGADDGEKAPDEQGTTSRVSQGLRKASSNVVDDWAASGDEDEDEDEDAGEDAGSGGESSSVVSDWDSNSNYDETIGGGLHKVLEAFTKLRDEFDDTFRKTWA